MAEKTWAEWYDAVLPHLPGLPTGAPADYFIKRAAIEFLDRTGVWQEDLAAFNAVAGTGTYTLTAPVAGTKIARLLELYFSGKDLTSKTPAWLKEHYGAQNWRSVSGGSPTYWTSEYPGKVTVVAKPTANTANAFTGRVSLKPLETATGIEEAFWSEYHEEIAKLAKARAMELTRRPFSNPQEALRLNAEVDSAIGFITLDAARGRSRAPMRTRTHWT